MLHIYDVKHSIMRRKRDSSIGFTMWEPPVPCGTLAFAVGVPYKAPSASLRGKTKSLTFSSYYRVVLQPIVPIDWLKEHFTSVCFWLTCISLYIINLPRTLPFSRPNFSLIVRPKPPFQILCMSIIIRSRFFALEYVDMKGLQLA